MMLSFTWCSFSSHFATANQFGAMESSRCDASKVLSSILRREASSHGLAMDEDGWVKVSDLISSDTVQLRLGLKSKLLMLDFKCGPKKTKERGMDWEEQTCCFRSAWGNVHNVKMFRVS